MIISDSLTQFYSNQYVTLAVTSEQVFTMQSQSLMQKLIFSTSNSFSISLQMIRGTTEANRLFGVSGSQYVFGKEQGGDRIKIGAVLYPHCDCDLSARCIEQSAIFNATDFSMIFDVPGMFYGCFAIEALLQSTLECFYNQTCIDILQSYMISSPAMVFSALDASLASQFHTNATIQDLVNRLMVETWNLSSTYADYYDECRPVKCSYTYETRNGLLYTGTSFLGLVSGLVAVLKFIVPRLVKGIPWLITFLRRKQRIRQLEVGKLIIFEIENVEVNDNEAPVKLDRRYSTIVAVTVILKGAVLKRAH